MGVAWLHETCGVCPFCRRGEENLCERARFTGWTADGGYADWLTVPEGFAVQVPDELTDLEAAPLLCAGVIGYRAVRRAEVEPGERVGLMGFGSSAHLVLQLLAYWGCDTVVLTRGARHRELARELGASWVGDAAELPPVPCDRVVVFAPAGELVPVALQLVRPGGVVSLAGIHMSPIPTFDYSLLWRERTLRSVANMTRRDADEFMALAAQAAIRAEVETVSARGRGRGADRDRRRPGPRRRGAGGVVAVRRRPGRSRRTRRDAPVGACPGASTSRRGCAFPAGTGADPCRRRAGS